MPIFTVLQSTVVRRRPTKEVIAELELDHREIYKAVEARDEERGAPPHGRAPRLPARSTTSPGINSTEGFDQPKAKRQAAGA